MRTRLVQLSLAALVVLAGVTLRRAFAAFGGSTGWSSATVAIGCSPLPHRGTSLEPAGLSNAQSPRSTFGSLPKSLPRSNFIATNIPFSLRFGTSPVPLPPPSFGTSPVPLPPPTLVSAKTAPEGLNFGTSPVPLPPPSFGTSPVPLPPPTLVSAKTASEGLNFGTSPVPLPPPGFGTSPVPPSFGADLV